MKTVRLAVLAAALGTLFVAAPPSRAGIAETRHNLSATGPGPTRAATETQICLFCHAPHNASPAAPLWNRRSPGANYTPYTSAATRGNPGQPNGASLLCLSCHDGTIALGEVLTRATPIPMAGGVTTMPTGPGRLGTDLSDDHPVSFAYTAALASARNNELVNPGTLTGRVKLDAAGQMQCTSCHDPHDDTNGKFLVLPNGASALCVTCHLKPGWSAGSHATSNKTWNGTGTDPWPTTSGTTVAANACENCHRPHSAPGRRYLLHGSTEEGTCYACHAATVATANIQSEFNKISRHGVANTTGTHDPTEPAVVASMHVECVDCHNPHATKAGAGTPAGPLTAVRGVNIDGAEVAAVSFEYQVCLRCHGDSTSRTPTPPTQRQIVQGNVRLEFATANPSFHPVAGVGRSTNVPSLIAPWTTASTVKCSDCHNNNSGPGAGGSGPNGPHGSIYPSLLERQYVTTDNASESAANYALCYKCHSRSSILGNATFGEHNKHISGERTPCNVCHDPHGISATQGNATNNSRLINFDTIVVRPSSSGQLRFESTSTNHGRCYLTCHGRNHNPETY